MSLNPVDWKTATFSNLAFPKIAGVDVAGEISEVRTRKTPFSLINCFGNFILHVSLQIGPDVAGDWAVGDRVCAHLDLRGEWGGFAEYCIALSHVLVRIPEGVSFQDAAAIPCAGWTAHLALYHRMNIASGKTLVIAGASGGVGSFAVQLAKQRGVRIIATCSRKNFDFVKKLGADECIDYSTDNIAAKIKELCGPVGPHYWLDNVGADSCDTALQVLAFGGHLAVVVAGPTAAALATNTVAYRCQSIDYITLGGAYRSADPADAHRFVEMGEDMLGMVERGKLTTNVSHVIKFDEIPKYLQLLKEGFAGNGKIVATLPPKEK